LCWIEERDEAVARDADKFRVGCFRGHILTGMVLK
jgi:hypothetical protein